MKVSIAEGNPIELKRLRSLLELSGHQVLGAESGKQAYQIACDAAPRMAIINTALPDMRGMELFYRLRIHKALREIIVLLANPNITDDEVFEGFCLRSDFHWQSPLDTADLTKLMRLLASDENENSPRFQELDFTGSWPNSFTKSQHK